MQNLIEITPAQALFIGLWAAIAVTGTLLGNYTATPIIYATGIGVILSGTPGALANAIVVGAAGQTVWLGFGISQGGVRPPDPIAPGIFAPVVALSAQPIIDGRMQLMTITDAGVFIGYSVPVGILMQLLITLLFTAMSPMSQLATKAVEKGKFRLFSLYSNLTLIVLMVVTFAFGTVVGFSANFLSGVANNLPDWLRTGFRVAGGMLPALGFALILKVMLKKEYLGFALLGYFLTLVFEAIAVATKTQFSILGLAIAVSAFVLIIMSLTKILDLDKLKAQAAAPVQVHSNKQNAEGEYEDGI